MDIERVEGLEEGEKPVRDQVPEGGCYEEVVRQGEGKEEGGRGLCGAESADRRWEHGRRGKETCIPIFYAGRRERYRFEGELLREESECRCV